MADHAGLVSRLEWTSDGAYPTRGIVCADGVFLGQYCQKPIALAGREGWETYQLPHTTTGAACYRIDAKSRTADAPSNSLVLEEFAWWNDALYAVGWELHSSGNIYPTLWRRDGVNDWAVVWQLAVTHPALWDNARWLRLCATTEGLVVYSTDGHQVDSRDLGVLYTGVATSCGPVLWAGSVAGESWVLTLPTSQPEVFQQRGMIPLSWGLNWLAAQATDGWTASNFCAWRDRVWVMLTRYDLANKAQYVRLGWVTSAGTFVIVWDAKLALDFVGDIVDALSSFALVQLVATRDALWGRLGNHRALGWLGEVDLSSVPLDVMLRYDGQTVQPWHVEDRSLGWLGDPLFAGRFSDDVYLVENVNAQALGSDWFGQDRPDFAEAELRILATPLEVMVKTVELEWSDGSETGQPAIELVQIEWEPPAGEHWDNVPTTEAVNLEWSDGRTVGLQPTVLDVAVDWSDGSQTEDDPTVLEVTLEWEASITIPEPEDAGLAIEDVSIEWANAVPAIDVNEEVLWLLETGTRLCHALRVELGGLTPTEVAQCRVYVRSDNETAAIDDWSTYQLGAPRQTIYLGVPGYIIRCGIIGPNTLNHPDVCVSLFRETP